MGRRKKVKNVLSELKPEVSMPEVKELEAEVKNEVVVSQSEVLENLESEVDRARMELENTKREIEEKKKELDTMSMREVTKDEMIIVKKDVGIQSKNKALTEKIQAQKEYDDVKITGKFINRRAPGQKAKLTYLKYDTDPVKWYEFEDGKVYTIPRGFADQLNEHYYTPAFTQKTGAILDPSRPESVIHEVDTTNKKYAFFPVNY